MSRVFEPYDVAVAGAGISGLVCALALKRAGLRVAVIESAGYVGGTIASASRDGCIADGGPQTFSITSEFAELVQSLDCAQSLERAKARPAMFIASRGRLAHAPVGPAAFLGSPLLAPWEKARVLVEPLIGARAVDDDESLADFAARRGGRAIVDALVRPMVAGIFAGDPARTSVRSAFPRLVEYERRYTSVMIGAVASRRNGGRRPPACNLRGGNASLPLAIAAELGLEVRLDAPVVECLLRGAHIELAYGGSRPGSVVARHAVLALPAYASGSLLRRLEPEAAAALAAIPYAPIAQVALSYPRTAIGYFNQRRDENGPASRSAGFGFLTGARSGLRVLGCAWNSEMFDDRCPPDRSLLTAFLGGVGDPDALTLGDDELVRVAHNDLARVMRIADSPTVIAGFR
ncbi:MAG TPA: protoporphyrinogen oxidase, partial [Candidatus Eremiobacteraceae bacterium]|nr:protoporphyrinogen oxidase [Candidatus Eremiobacteraceae bacterium]